MQMEQGSSFVSTVEHLSRRGVAQARTFGDVGRLSPSGTIKGPVMGSISGGGQ
jgi:hypothetical protein